MTWFVILVLIGIFAWIASALIGVFGWVIGVILLLAIFR